jgi:predicted dienelactone hydrolase
VKILKVLFFGLLGVLLLLLGMSAWFSPEGFPAGSVTDQRAAMARYSVRTESLQLIDPTRVTQARNGVEEASGREFKGKLFAPISQKASDNFPLLIYSHGFSSSHRGGVYLGEYLAM